MNRPVWFARADGATALEGREAQAPSARQSGLRALSPTVRDDEEFSQLQECEWHCSDEGYLSLMMVAVHWQEEDRARWAFSAHSSACFTINDIGIVITILFAHTIPLLGIF